MIMKLTKYSSYANMAVGLIQQNTTISHPSEEPHLPVSADITL